MKCGEPATDVDHIVPHKGNHELFWDRDNWQALCHHCHSVKTATEDGGWGRQPKQHATAGAAASGADAPPPPGGLFWV